MTAKNFTDEPQLVAALQRQDPAAFRYAVSHYSGPLLATARAIAGSANAEDVVQEAWLTAFRRIEDFEGRAALRTWLQRLVVNGAISLVRKRKREVDLEVEGAAADADWFDQRGRWRQAPPQWHGDSPEALLSADALNSCLDKHLALMPDNQRLVLVMRDMQEQEFDAICNELALSASNVRVLLHRARLRLVAMVNNYQETGTC